MIIGFNAMVQSPESIPGREIVVPDKVLGESNHAAQQYSASFADDLAGIQMQLFNQIKKVMLIQLRINCEASLSYNIYRVVGRDILKTALPITFEC